MTWRSWIEDKDLEVVSRLRQARENDGDGPTRWLATELLAAVLVLACAGCLPSAKSSEKACKHETSAPVDVSIQTIDPYFKVTLLRIDEIPLSETKYPTDLRTKIKTVAADIAFESRSSELVWVNLGGRGIIVRTTPDQTWKKVADLELRTADDQPSTGYDVYQPIGGRLSRSGQRPEAEHSHFAGADPTDSFALLPHMNGRARLIFLQDVAACKPYSLNLVRRDTTTRPRAVRLESEAPPQFPGISPSGSSGRAFDVSYRLIRTDQASWVSPAVAKEALGPGFHWQHVETGVTNDSVSTFDVGRVFPMLLSAAGFVHLVDHINVNSTQRLLPTGQSMQVGYYFLVSSSETSEMFVLTTFDNNTPAQATQTQTFVWVV